MMANLKRLGGVCLECAGGFERTKRDMEFCCSSCRKAWGNRRMTRGAELYDLFMAIRFNRTEAISMGLWQAVCRMASLWRQDDTRHRAGRRSWRKPRDVLDTRPYLKTIATSIRVGR